MPTRLQNDEDERLRQTFSRSDGTIYVRVYNVDPQDIADVPSEGDPMPGEMAALLGPFIVRDGIRWGKQREGARQQLVITSKLLSPRTAGATGNYIELAGRRPGKRGGNIVYATLGVSTGITYAPKRGQTLSDPDISHSAGAVCMSVNTDSRFYPGRVFVQALWDAPMRWNEIGGF